MDEADMADEKSQLLLDKKIANIRSLSRAITWAGEPRDCATCGEDIPAARLAIINTTLCVGCAWIQ